MATLTSHETKNYSLEIRGRLAVLRLSGDAFALSTSLDIKKDYMGLLEQIDEAPDLNALLVLSHADGLGQEKYRSFLAEAADVDATEPGAGDGSAMSVHVHRLKNGLNHFLKTAATYRKILLIGLAGEIVPPFFAVSLAADYVYAAEGMTFQPAHLDLGSLPGGCLAPFPVSVDARTIRDLLFSTVPIGAPELMKRGLIDGCLPTEGFEQECIAKAEELAALPLDVITRTKALMCSRAAIA